MTATGPTKTYGTALTTGSSTTNFTTTGLQNGETVGSVTLTPNAAGLSATTAAGASYTVTPSAATGGTFATANYSITYTAYAGAIAQAPLTVTANAQSKTYGQTMTFGSSTLFTKSGLKNSDAIGTVTITDTDNGGAATAAAGGTYDLTPSAAVFSTGSAGNYSITYSPGLLTVNKATPTVTVTVGPTPTMASPRVRAAPPRARRTRARRLSVTRARAVRYTVPARPRPSRLEATRQPRMSPPMGTTTAPPPAPRRLRLARRL